MNRLFEAVNDFFESNNHVANKLCEGVYIYLNGKPHYIDDADMHANGVTLTSDEVDYWISHEDELESQYKAKTNGKSNEDIYAYPYHCTDDYLKFVKDQANKITEDESEESDKSSATILDFEETGGGCLNYVGEIDNYNFVGEIGGVLEFFDKKFNIDSWNAYESIEDDAWNGKYGEDIKGAFDFEQKYAEHKPEYFPAVAEALQSYTDNISNFVYSSLVDEEVKRLLSSLEESTSLLEAGSKIDPIKAFVTIYSSYYDGMGDFSDSYDYITSLADDCGIKYDDSISSSRDLNSLTNKVITFIYNNHQDMFKDISSDLIDSIDVDYLADTLEHKQGIVKCFEVLKDYVSDSNKVDTIISQLQSVNVDIRLIAQEFQRYFYDNYQPWNFLGTTTGPRVYNNLFDCPTDYEVVSSDYFNYSNYSNRPSDMLDNIGYGWKQTDNGVQADLIGFGHSVKGSSVVYDQPPVTYGYSTIIDNSNKNDKFKEMADTLVSKAKEIKSKYNLGK